MNGFKDDIVSILKHCVMYHKKSMGLILGVKQGIKYCCNLLDYLIDEGLYVSGIKEKLIPFWDYIVVPSKLISVRTIIQSLTSLSDGGILILEITGKDNKYENVYKGFIGNLKATKVIYEDRAYLVIHTGDEYGN